MASAAQVPVFLAVDNVNGASGYTLCFDFTHLAEFMRSIVLPAFLLR